MQMRQGVKYVCSCGLGTPQEAVPYDIQPGQWVWLGNIYDSEGRGLSFGAKDHQLSEWNIMVNAPTEATKYDGSKPPLHLIAPDFLYAVAEILDFGAKKYAPRNWEKGMDWSRCYRAAIGHLFDWFMRKGPDPETGKSHLWHAACCIMFLVCYEIRSVGTDDRP